MRRDTRANLIFLALFFTVAIPGIVKLTARAYRPGGRDPAMRTPVRGQFAYMDPSPPIGLPRVVPPGVAAFTARIAARLETMQRGLRSVVSSERDEPVMSDHLNLQVLGRGPWEGRYHVAFFGWNGRYAPLPELYEITAMRRGAPVKGEMNAYEPQILPLGIRSELQEFGYVVPPESVLWFIVSFPGDAPVDSVNVRFHLDNTSLDDTVTLPGPTTMPATAPPTTDRSPTAP